MDSSIVKEYFTLTVLTLDQVPTREINGQSPATVNTL